jgi:hypothetical protein
MLWGDIDRFNPDLPMDEQVELLPYDVRWEFPRNRVQLGNNHLINKALSIINTLIN